MKLTRSARIAGDRLGEEEKSSHRDHRAHRARSTLTTQSSVANSVPTLILPDATRPTRRESLSTTQSSIFRPSVLTKSALTRSVLLDAVLPDDAVVRR